MRILHVLDHSLPLQSGYVYRTLGIVKRQRELGWDPVLLTSGKHYALGPVRERIGEWEFLRTPPPTGALAKFPVINELRIIGDLGRRLDDILPEIKPDILHAHSPVLNALAVLRAGRRHHLPVVYEVRAFWEDARVSSDSGNRTNWRYHLTRQLETHALRRADAIVTICEGLSRDVIARGIPREKVTVVPNAVDPDAFVGASGTDPSLVAQLGLKGKTVIGFFGSFYFYEGLHLLMRALPTIRKHRPDIAVLLGGGGPEEANLRGLAEELGLGSAVVFAGRIPHEDIQRYYALIDLLVLPRVSMRLTDLVTPLKPLEAMAQQRIVAASNVGGHCELIRDRETGYLFRADHPERLAEGVLGALNDRASWPDIRARALHYVQTERSWSNSVARYAPVYDRLRSRVSRGATHRTWDAC